MQMKFETSFSPVNATEETYSKQSAKCLRLESFASKPKRVAAVKSDMLIFLTCLDVNRFGDRAFMIA